MKLFNTRMRQIDTFTPLDGKNARIYSCGPTVYNYAHIGNLSSYIYADILRRAVRLAGFQTQHVMNLTDVDDKTIRDSRAEFPGDEPENALKKLTEKYATIFMDEMRAVGNDVDAIAFDRATDNIDEIQNLIRRLLRQQIAYIAEDGIYFSISKYKKTRVYGQLSHVNFIENNRARVANDEYDKDSAQDFALWKFAKPGEPKWAFDLAEFSEQVDAAGRPGWHIECSVMSTKNLGQPFDIHTGGVDLIFPHHENEIAQSTAGDQPELLANFFVHNEYLLVDGKKMSKSAHNFYTLSDIKKRGYDPLDFRMLVLQSHYKSATNFSWENLEAAKNRRKNWRTIAELRWQVRSKNELSHAEWPSEEMRSMDFITYMGKWKDALGEDLDTPSALATLDQTLNELSEQHLFRERFDYLIDEVDEYLGLNLRATTPDITDAQKEIIREVNTARAEKDFTRSDELRDELLRENIELKFTPNGTIWSRK